MCLGTNFIYDFPGSIGVGGSHSIEHRFVSHNASYTQAMNQGLYAAYSFPNTILVVVGGALIDTYLGLRRSTIVFAGIALTGSAIFLIGVISIEYSLLVSGRILLGCGCECLGIAQSAWSTKWFANHKALPLAFAISVALQRVGGALNFLFSVRIAQRLGICDAVSLGVAAVGLSAIVAAALVMADYSLEKKAALVPSLLQERQQQQTLVRRFNLKDVCRLPGRLWILAAACGFIYVSLLPFLGFAVQFFQVRFGLSAVEASETVSLYLFAVAVGCPLAGLIVSRLSGQYPRSGVWVLVAASALLTASLSSFVMGPGSGSHHDHAHTPPAALVPFLAASFCFISATLFPAVPKVVDGMYLGTAFGVLTAVIAFTGAVMRIVVGIVLDHRKEEGTGTRTLLPAEGGFVLLVWMLVGAGGAAVTASMIFAATAPAVNSVKPSAIEEFEGEQEQKGDDCEKIEQQDEREEGVIAGQGDESTRLLNP